MQGHKHNYYTIKMPLDLFSMHYEENQTQLLVTSGVTLVSAEDLVLEAQIPSTVAASSPTLTAALSPRQEP